jgi:hypothetical protein
VSPRREWCRATSKAALLAPEVTACPRVKGRATEARTGSGGGKRTGAGGAVEGMAAGGGAGTCAGGRRHGTGVDGRRQGTAVGGGGGGGGGGVRRRVEKVRTVDRKELDK